MLAASAGSVILASRYCDVCDGWPWWAQTVLIVVGFGIAIAILSGLVRLDGWLSRRRRPPKGGPEE